jgi:photosystem II stability/assembly factor-like uncharacterized protein
MKIKLILILYCIVKLNFGQELKWEHTGGPMGGIIGGMDINSKGEIYAGVYPFSANYTGLYKSTDNGITWNEIETPIEDFEVFCIYITKDDHIWVGTDYQGALHRSTDNGVTWENKNNGFGANEGWAIGESKDGVLFAGDANVGRLYRSTNNGDNWEFSANIAPLAFAVDSNNVVYAGCFNGLYISTNNGISWTQNNYLAGYIIPSVITDTNNIVYCGTGYTFPYMNGNGIFSSKDVGQNWEQIGLANKVVLSLGFDSEMNLYAGTLEDGLFITTDMGQDWKQCQNGIYKKEVYRLEINKQDDIFIGSEGGGNGWSFYGGGGVFRSTDGGNLFEQVGLPISYVSNFVFSGDSLIIAATPSGVQSFNRENKKWKNLSLQNVEAVTITPSNFLYAATKEDGLFKSTDLGQNWTLTNLTIDTLMPVYNVLAINEDTLFAATGADKYLRKSTNGGQVWSILPIRTGEWEKGLFFNGVTLFAIGFTPGNTLLYKSNDYGESFETIYSGFTTFNSIEPVYALSDDYIFLASRGSGLFGVIRSIDNGISWEQILFDDKISPAIFANDDGIVITGTAVLSYSDTNKVIVSTNYGNNWSDAIPPTKWGTSITSIKQDESGNLFFGTSGEGLFEVDIITNINEETKYTLSGFKLSQNYPNPFNPTTAIKFELPERRQVTLKVYDVLGNEIATLVNEEKPGGSYEVEFNASNLTSGIYFCRLQAGSYIETRKMILLK